MSKQVLLINPDSPFLFDSRALPPLGILYLGAALEANGFEPKVVDLAKKGATLEGFDPGMIGISCVTAKFPDMAGIVASCKKAYPGVPVIVGGPHFSICPDDWLKVGADAVGLGSCEDAIVIAARDATQSGKFGNWEYSSPGWVVDANKYPIPARHLIPIHEYSYVMYDHATTPLISAYGCPYGCSFCCKWEGYRKVRTRNTDNVLEEIGQLKGMGFRSLIFYDDEFNLRTDRMVEICRAIAPEKIRFRAIIRSDLFNEAQAEALAMAGCVEVSVGVESGSRKILEIIGKRTTPEINTNCRNLCRKYGLRFKAFTIIGLPGETRETVEETKRWLIDNQVDDLTVSRYMPYIGTPIVQNPQDYDVQFGDLDYEHTYMAFRGSADVDLANISRTTALSAEEIKTLRKEVEDEVRASCDLVPQPRREDRVWRAESTPRSLFQNGNPMFSICHTTARPQAWQACYEAWKAACTNWENVEYVLCVDERWGFPEDFQHPGIKVVWNDKRKCCVDGFNIAAAASTGKILILNSDDMVPPYGWDSGLMAAIPNLDSDFVVAVPTSPSGVYTLQIFSRKRYERLGYALYPEYLSVYADNDFTDHAIREGVVLNGMHLQFKHNHPGWYGPGWDDIYQHENSASAYEIGRAVLAKRQASNFPPYRS